MGGFDGFDLNRPLKSSSTSTTQYDGDLGLDNVFPPELVDHTLSSESEDDCGSLGDDLDVVATELGLDNIFPVFD